MLSELAARQKMGMATASEEGFLDAVVSTAMFV